MLWALAGALLVGYDLYLSHRRMKTYGALVELNPIARELAQSQGIWAGTAFLGLYNAALITALASLKDQAFLHALVGAKIGLISMQLKSLQIENYVERILSGKSTQASKHRL